MLTPPALFSGTKTISLGIKEVTRVDWTPDRTRLNLLELGLAPKKTLSHFSLSEIKVGIKFIAGSVIQSVWLTGSKCENLDLNCRDNTSATGPQVHF